MITRSRSVRKIEEIVGEPLTFASMLRSERECLELSQAEFGKILGVSRSYICDVEKSRKTVSVHQAVRFAQALGLSELVFAQLALEDEIKDLDFSITLSNTKKKKSRKTG